MGATAGVPLGEVGVDISRKYSLNLFLSLVGLLRGLVQASTLLRFILLPLGLRVELRLVTLKDALEIRVAKVPLTLAKHNTFGLLRRFLAVFDALSKLP